MLNIQGALGSLSQQTNVGFIRDRLVMLDKMIASRKLMRILSWLCASFLQLHLLMIWATILYYFKYLVPLFCDFIDWFRLAYTKYNKWE